MYHIARFDCTRKMPDFKFWRFSQKKIFGTHLYILRLNDFKNTEIIFTSIHSQKGMSQKSLLRKYKFED